MIWVREGGRGPTRVGSSDRGKRQPHTLLSWCRSTVVSTLTSSSQESFAELVWYSSGRTPLSPPARSPRLLRLYEPMHPVTTVLAVITLWFATRLIMSSEAMTCSIDRIRRPVRRSGSRKSTNLGLTKNGREGIHDSRFRLCNDQQRAHSVKRRRLDQHGDDGVVQSSESTWRPHDCADVPVVQDEPDDDHKGEENVERDRDRIVWNVKVEADGLQDVAARWRGPVDEC